VAVIGAGGLGAPVLSYLAAAGVGEITLFDPDTVDGTNLHRQVLFTTADVGRAKAVAAAAHLRVQNAVVLVRAVVRSLTPDAALAPPTPARSSTSRCSGARSSPSPARSACSGGRAGAGGPTATCTRCRRSPVWCPGAPRPGCSECCAGCSALRGRGRGLRGWPGG